MEVSHWEELDAHTLYFISLERGDLNCLEITKY